MSRALSFKAKRIICLAFLSVLTLKVSANESMETYLMLYRNAGSLADKYLMMKYILELKDPSTAPALTSILEELLLQQQNLKTQIDKDSYNKLVKAIAAALGDYGYRESEDRLWDLVLTSIDPLVRAESLIALGKVGASAYVEKIAKLLSDLNLTPTDDVDAGEKVAFGAILALRNLKDGRGWVPVFHAYDGWYSKRTKQLAELALPSMNEDPTDIIKTILPTETIPRKIFALDQEMISSASGTRKIEVAVLALSEGHRLQGRDRTQQSELATLRKNAVIALIQLKSKNPEALYWIKLSFDLGEVDEKLLALQALGVDAGDEAAIMLRNIILDFDKLRKDNIYDSIKDQLATAAIQNAGSTRNQAVKPGLLAVVSNTKWSGPVVKAANAALKSLE